jgi:maltose O-acetyltransferase
MTSEKQKMLSGELYDASDKELTEARVRARQLRANFNGPVRGGTTRTGDELSALIPQSGATCPIQPPFYCDYGTNIVLGDDVYFNFNCVVLDVCPIVIGSRTLLGPAVQICHLAC